MRLRTILSVALVAASVNVLVGQTARPPRLNPLIELLEQKKPVFGLYVPSNRRPGGPAAAPMAGAPEAPPRTPMELAKDALATRVADYLFDGSMEASVERALPAFTDLITAMGQVGVLSAPPARRLTHPLMVKTHEIAPDPAKATENIGKQLNLGVSGIVFVGVESAEEIRTGLAAMRFASKGGTRSTDVGPAPAFWGMTEQQYRTKADLWPLNPAELLNWTIVESKVGLAHVREIAAVKGISMLFPGAGTLRGVFTAANATGEKVFDADGWEAAIQQVLAACKEFDVPCGYPATANDIEMRMKQGFSVFVINWGEAGFKTVEIGRRLAGRPMGHE